MKTTRSTWVLAIGVGLVLAAATGALAAVVVGDALRFVVYGAMSLPCWIGLVVVLRTPDGRPPHHEDSVESQWLARSNSAAFLDVLMALGLATFVTSVLDTPDVPTVAFLVLALADSAVRYGVLQRRES